MALPNPLAAVTGRDALDAADDLPDGESPSDAPDSSDRLNIGGRHGSPSIAISLPFSSISIAEAPDDVVDAFTGLAEIVVELCGQVATLASEAASPAVGHHAEELATRAGALLTELASR
jgi:hypothetical protein